MGPASKRTENRISQRLQKEPTKILKKSETPNRNKAPGCSKKKSVEKKWKFADLTLAKEEAHTPGTSESLRAKKKRTSLNGRATAWPAKRFPQRIKGNCFALQLLPSPLTHNIHICYTYIHTYIYAYGMDPSRLYGICTYIAGFGPSFGKPDGRRSASSA